MVPGDVIGKIGAALIVQEATERDAVLVTWVHSLCGSSSFETCRLRQGARVVFQSDLRGGRRIGRWRRVTSSETG